MPPNESFFDDRLRMSNGHLKSSGVDEILLKTLPGARQVIKACSENDRNGVDFWVERTNTTLVAVDVKVRELDYCALTGEDDLALETWSVIEKQKIGWTRDETKRCDYILWIWIDTGRYCLIPFALLCAVMQNKWESWKRQYKVFEQRTKDCGGYRSECVFVPRRVVWTEIYNRFSGRPIPSPTNGERQPGPVITFESSDWEQMDMLFDNPKPSAKAIAHAKEFFRQWKSA